MRRTPAVPLAAVLVALVLLLVPTAQGTGALFGDSAALGTGSFAAGRLAAPSALGCTQQGGNARITWTTPTQPQFRVRLLRSGRELGAPITVTTNAVTLTPALLSELLGGAATVEIRTQLPGTPWVSATTTRPVTIGALGLSVNC